MHSLMVGADLSMEADAHFCYTDVSGGKTY